MVGKTLSHYEILEQIGKGGMGEVYLAEDKTLGRKVALKVLAETVSADNRRMNRFEREARSLAAINHPNIVTIYTVEEAEGTRFLTMELVEGRSLDKLIPDGGLPSERFFALSIPIADALATAHEKGITHRDLKPSNVMVSEEGRVKVLDFGLAKLLPRFDEFESTQAATEALTQEGRLVGTVPYMSPEQIEGGPVDHRTDVFALGIVLYEMATGRRPFGGDTSPSLMSSILKDQPPSVTEIREGVPRQLARIIGRCLEKDPRRRFQSALDLKNELDELRQEVESGVTQPASTTTTTGAAPRSRIPWLVAVAAVVALAAVLGWMILARRDAATTETDQPPVSQSMRITQLTTAGVSRDAAISPDGKLVVHVVEDASGQSLWIRQVVTASDVQIVPAARAKYDGLTFSPDGNFVYFVRGEERAVQGDLYVVPALGGAERLVLKEIDGPVSFSPDSRRMAFIRAFEGHAVHAVVLADADGTEEREISRGEGLDLMNSSSAAWAPDGSRIAVTGGRLEPRFEEMIMVVPVEGGDLAEVSSRTWLAAGPVAWLPDGSGLVVAATSQATYTGDQLWRVSYPEGEVSRITNDLNDYDHVSIAASGESLVTIQDDIQSLLWIVPASPEKEARKVSISPRNYDGLGGLDWTDDGRIVFDSLVGGEVGIWVARSDGGNREQLTSGARLDFAPRVCGSEVVFLSDRGGNVNVWRVGLGGGNPIQLTFGALDVAASCPRDGQWILFMRMEKDQNVLYRLPIEGGEPQKVTAEDVAFGSGSVSPDGERISYGFVDKPSDRYRMAVIDVGGGEPTHVLDYQGGPSAWAPDGSAYDFAVTRDGVTNIWRYRLEGGEPERLTDFETDRIFSFRWSPDGEHLALTRGARLSDVILIEGF